MLAMGYQILYSILTSLAILFFVLYPLKTIQSSIRSYKETKDSAEVTETLSKIQLNNEIGELATDFTDLTHEIDDYVDVIQKITSEKERMGAELSLAKQIQTSMLPQEFPPFPERGEFDIYASMDPAREVGGDFYDYFMTDDDHLWLVIADVSGKGIPAALFMMISMIILRIHARTGGSPAEVLAKANDSICSRNTVEMFVTVWIGVLEISTGKITAANAGHEYPAVKHADGQFELMKDKHGLVVGGMEGVKYKEYDIELEPGSKLFVYTDGVPEATAEDKEMFGTDRMIDALNKDPDASPEEILRNVRRDVDDFVQDAVQFDDLTMLCMQYKG
jgi:sigma-B regulation protein RsbU (phosphoserine phosphatase)